MVSELWCSICQESLSVCHCPAKAVRDNTLSDKMPLDILVSFLRGIVVTMAEEEGLEKVVPRAKDATPFELAQWCLRQYVASLLAGKKPFAEAIREYVEADPEVWAALLTIVKGWPVIG